MLKAKEIEVVEKGKRGSPARYRKTDRFRETRAA
jgi:hypothetical protein